MRRRFRMWRHSRPLPDTLLLLVAPVCALGGVAIVVLWRLGAIG